MRLSLRPSGRTNDRLLRGAVCPAKADEVVDWRTTDDGDDEDDYEDDDVDEDDEDDFRWAPVCSRRRLLERRDRKTPSRFRLPESPERDSAWRSSRAKWRRKDGIWKIDAARSA